MNAVPEKNAKPVASAADAVARINPKLIEKVGIELEALLGSARLTVGELTSLSAGAVVPLDTALNQSVELRLNDMVVARGEVVAVGDQFGVRLSEIAQWPG